MDDVKRCPTCGVTRPLEGFQRNRSRPDGRHGECKWCQLDRLAEWRRRNPERRREQQRRYRARQRGAA